jgi:hypothetical protein
MQTINNIRMFAPVELIFSLAVDVERWPVLLRHYRYVYAHDEPMGRVVRMGARRGPIPVHWTALQAVDHASLEIRYTHTGGVTLGMEVIWRLRPDGEATEVSIDHGLTSPRVWLRNRAAEYIVGDQFVVPIADATLRGIKHAAESGRRSAR